jgi:hypothetical protein
MRPLLAAAFIAVLVVVFFLAVRLLPQSSREARPNIRIVSRLDEYTRNSNPQVANTIPTFLAQPGALGVVAMPAASTEDGAEEATPAPTFTTGDVKPINEAELQKGFCTPSLASLVRQQYPGSYDNIPDTQLEKTVIETRPEYLDRVCVLPVWMPAPQEIVKYEVASAGPMAIGWPRLMVAALFTAAFGLAAGAAILKLRIKN